MPGNDPSTYDVNEVCVWLTAIGLGHKVDLFRENAIDGAMLVDLEGDDFRELELSNLQVKKVKKMIKFTKELACVDSAGDALSEMEVKIKSQEDTIAELKKEIKALNNENVAMKMQLEDAQGSRIQSAPIPQPLPVSLPCELITVAHYQGTWNASKEKFTKTKQKYQKQRCFNYVTCNKMVRTYCKCTKGLFLCIGCFANHKVSVAMQDSTDD